MDFPTVGPTVLVWLAQSTAAPLLAFILFPHTPLSYHKTTKLCWRLRGRGAGIRTLTKGFGVPHASH